MPAPAPRNLGATLPVHEPLTRAQLERAQPSTESELEQTQRRAPNEDAEAEQETTNISPTTAPPPADLDDDESTKLGEVPAAVLEQLRQIEAPAMPRRSVPTQLGAAAAAPPKRQMRTQLGVPALTDAGEDTETEEPTRLKMSSPLTSPPQDKRRLAATQIGIPPPAAPLSSIPPPLEAPRPSTLAGVPLPANAPPHLQRQPPLPSQGAAPPPQASSFPSTAPGRASSAPGGLHQPAPRRVPNASPTLLGGVLADAAAAVRAPSTPAAAGTRPLAPIDPQLAAPALPLDHTAQPVGFAPDPPPGFAPQPGFAPPQGFAPSQGFAPPQGSAEAAPQQPLAPPPKRRGVSVFLVLVLLAAVIATCGYLGLRWHQGREAVLFASLDASGKDLEITCPSCVDGTAVALYDGALAARFVQQRARLILAEALEVGEHELPVVMQAPGEPPRRYRLPVAVEFRLITDTSTLHDYPPKLTYHTKVREGGALSIGGQVVKDRYELLVGELAEGPSNAVVKTELETQYRYERPGLEVREGKLREEIAILPLRLFSPRQGAQVHGDTLQLQGQAPPGVEVRVGEHGLKPDSSGLFSQEVALTAGENAITVWLLRPDGGFGGVSRGATVRVHRSENPKALWDDAKARLSKPGDLQALFAAPAGAVGTEYVFTGEVVEAQAQRSELVVLLDASPTAAGVSPNAPGACRASSCLLRVVASDVRFRQGDKLRGVGRSVEPRDKKTPELEAYVLEKR